MKLFFLLFLFCLVSHSLSLSFLLPLLSLQLHNLMEEQAKKLLKEHGVSYSDGKVYYLIPISFFFFLLFSLLNSLFFPGWSHKLFNCLGKPCQTPKISSKRGFLEARGRRGDNRDHEKARRRGRGLVEKSSFV